MTKEKKETKCDDLIDALLEKHGISPEAVLGENGLIAQLKKRVVERALAGELTHHLGYAKGEAPKRSITIATATARRRSSEKTELWKSRCRGIAAGVLSRF
jgi:transposase-like protein